MSPRVSLVVPLRDEEASVPALLRSIAAQSRPPDEVVLVDAGSTDRTAERVRALEGSLALRLVSAGPLHPGQARNAGVAQAAFDWLAFTDGGVTLEAGWLHHLLAAAEGGAEVVYGSYEPVCDSFFEQCAAVAYVPPLAEWGGRGPSVASMLLRREVMQAVGGFPPYRAAEDLVFMEKVAAGGFRIAHAPQAVAHWRLASTPRATFRRFALYSRHNLAAGRGRYWHRGLARQYAAVGVLVAVAWAAGAGPWSLAAVPAWMLARATKAAVSKRGSFPFETLHPARIAGAAAVLVLLDAATTAGALRWLAERLRGRGGPADQD